LVIDDGDILYNLLDLPQRHTTGDGTVVDYKYAFDGRKLQEKVTAGASVTQRDYSGEFLYEGGVLKKILFDGGYVINDVSGPVYMFFLRDHLGSVRTVVSETGAVQQMNHYFPYGDLFPNTSNDSSGNRYRYTGKESGDEIGLYDFSARFLHTRFGRFTTIDPLAEKYPGISPYAYCNGNPVNYVDPDGEHPVVVGALIGGAISGTAAAIKGKSFTEVIAATAGGAVDGAIGALGGKVVGKLACRIMKIGGLGAIGGGVGDVIEQGFNMLFGNQEEIDLKSAGASAAMGMVSTGVSESVESGLKSVAKSAITSRSTYEVIEKEVKAEIKSTGQNPKPSKVAKYVEKEVKSVNEAASSFVETSVIILDNTVGFYNDIYADEKR
jgi:RHS repeat-associated protein